MVTFNFHNKKSGCPHRANSTVRSFNLRVPALRNWRCPAVRTCRRCRRPNWPSGRSRAEATGARVDWSASRWRRGCRSALSVRSRHTSAPRDRQNISSSSTKGQSIFEIQSVHSTANWLLKTKIRRSFKKKSSECFTWSGTRQRMRAVIKTGYGK